MWLNVAGSIGGVFLGFSLAFGQVGGVVVNEFMALNESTLADPDGGYDDWVEFYNTGGQAVDLSGYYLTDNLDNPTRWKIPASQRAVIGPGQFLVFWFDDEPEQGPLHVGFKLAGEGEQIGLFAPDGITHSDTLSYSRQRVDVSQGRFPDGGAEWLRFESPTPGADNDTAGLPRPLPDPVLSLERGSYSGGVTISVESADEQARIHYTLDGSSPTPDSPAYTGPITVSETRVLRVRSFRDEYLPSQIITKTYLINEDYSMPLVSLATDEANLYDDEIGILVEGLAAQADPNCNQCQNWWQDWERPVHVEYFDVLGKPQFGLGMGVKVFGNSTRNFPKKSLTLVARGRYGAEEIDYELFPTKPQLDRFDGFQLRAGQRLRSMNDVGERQIRLAGGHMDIQATRHVIVFLNGSFHGLFNLLERKNIGFYRNNYGTDNVDVYDTIEGRLEGDLVHYEQTLDFINSPAYLAEDGFEQAERLVDMSSLIEHYVFNIMHARRDFGNIRFWRERTPEGRWRVLMFDLDNSTPNHPTLGFILGLEFPDRLFSMLGRLLQNETFRMRFLNRTADYLNSVYEPDYHEFVIRDIARAVEKEIFPDLARWEEQYGARPDEWYEGIETRVAFAKTRPDFLLEHYKDELGVDHSRLSLDVSGRGSIRINSVQVDRFPWSGRYFNGVPIRIEAVPAAGYSFVGWDGIVDVGQDPFNLVLDDSLQLTARFEADRSLPNIVINEINYHSAPQMDAGDWVELVNISPETVDLSGWMFGDDDPDSAFVMPDGLQLAPASFMVLCRDMDRFRAVYGSEADCIGPWNFGLSNRGEFIQLLEPGGVRIDTVRYNDKGDWTSEADGFGATLELIHPYMDNADPANWTYSNESGGTPGRSNSQRLGVQIELPDSPENFQFDVLPGYPNPFYSRTQLPFELDRSAYVEIRIYNTLGQLVGVPLSGVKSPGRHVVEWRPGNLPSGVYYYQFLINRESSDTGSIVYLK